jgi:hypothetical protein
LLSGARSRVLFLARKLALDVLADNLTDKFEGSEIFDSRFIVSEFGYAFAFNKVLNAGGDFLVKTFKQSPEKSVFKGFHRAPTVAGGPRREGVPVY